MEEPTPITLNVIVDRSRWLRGEGEKRSLLLRTTDDKMCCLGFACLAAGHTIEEISDMATPSELAREREVIVLLPDYKSVVMGDVMSVNDGERYEEDEREAYIAEQLATLGIAMTFVDGPVAQ